MKPENFIAEFLNQHADDIYRMPSDWEIRCEVKRVKDYCGNTEELRKRGGMAYIQCECAYICDPKYGESKYPGDCLKAVFRIKKPWRFWEAEFVKWLNQPKEAAE